MRPSPSHGRTHFRVVDDHGECAHHRPDRHEQDRARDERQPCTGDDQDDRDHDEDHDDEHRGERGGLPVAIGQRSRSAPAWPMVQPLDDRGRHEFGLLRQQCVAGTGHDHHRRSPVEQGDDVFGIGDRGDHVVGRLDHEHIGASGGPPHLDRRAPGRGALSGGHVAVPTVDPHRRIVPGCEERRAHGRQVFIRRQGRIEHRQQGGRRLRGRRDQTTACQQDDTVDAVRMRRRDHPRDAIAERVPDHGRRTTPAGIDHCGHVIGEIAHRHVGEDVVAPTDPSWFGH